MLKLILLKPIPSTTRAGTFDGIDKLFFEKGPAIESGEVTAPPEVVAPPRGLVRRVVAKLAALTLYQRIGAGLAAAVMIAAAPLTLGGPSKPVPVAPSAAPSARTAAPPSPLAPPAKAVTATTKTASAPTARSRAVRKSKSPRRQRSPQGR